MAVRILAGNNEVIASTETYVSSNLPTSVRVYLPKINDGTGGTIAINKEIRIESLGASSIEVVTLGGSRVGIVPARTKAVVVSQAGQAQGEPDRWVFSRLAAPSATFIADPTGGATIDAQARTAITSVLAVLKNAGLVKAE